MLKRINTDECAMITGGTVFDSTTCSWLPSTQLQVPPTPYTPGFSVSAQQVCGAVTGTVNFISNAPSYVASVGNFLNPTTQPPTGSQVAGSIDNYNTTNRNQPSLYDTGRNFSQVYKRNGDN